MKPSRKDAVDGNANGEKAKVAAPSPLPRRGVLNLARGMDKQTLTLMCSTLAVVASVVIASILGHSMSAPKSTIDSTNSQLKSQRDKKIQLAFGVMTYQKPDSSVLSTLQAFYRLMEVIYTPDDHVYVLHTDIKSDASLLHAISTSYCAAKRNCRSIPPRNVGWAGLSTGEMMMALMQKALEFDEKPCYDSPEVCDAKQMTHYYNTKNEKYSSNQKKRHSWEYFILIGHESIPLVSLSYIEGFLSSTLYPPQTNFINCWDVRGYDFFGQWEDNTWRLNNIFVESFQGWALENLWHVPSDSPAMRPFPEDIAFYKSIQLVVLSRQFVKYALFGPDVRRILLFLANVKTSDEMILPTLLQSNPTFASTATCDTTLHFTHWIRPGGSWHPEYLTLEHLPLLLNTTKHLFARKVNTDMSGSLLWALSRIRHEARSSFVMERDGIPLWNRHDYIANMTWVVPVAQQYLHSLLQNNETLGEVKSFIDKSGVLRCYGHPTSNSKSRGGSSSFAKENPTQFSQFSSPPPTPPSPLPPSPSTIHQAHSVKSTSTSSSSSTSSTQKKITLKSTLAYFTSFLTLTLRPNEWKGKPELLRQIASEKDIRFAPPPPRWPQSYDNTLPPSRHHVHTAEQLNELKSTKLSVDYHNDHNNNNNDNQHDNGNGNAMKSNKIQPQTPSLMPTPRPSGVDTSKQPLARALNKHDHDDDHKHEHEHEQAGDDVDDIPLARLVDESKNVCDEHPTPRNVLLTLDVVRRIKDAHESALYLQMLAEWKEKERREGTVGGTEGGMEGGTEIGNAG